MPHLSLAEQAYLLTALCAFAVFILALGGISARIMLVRRVHQALTAALRAGGARRSLD
ncbi:MAG: hypothetical protein IM662_12800 [Phenylobacterium sp.]|uniref:hypothetical protein n=1 Tax=Phenylobacterium sp. TaxID=1871053 RepID=UPI0025FDE3EB|nr:hypothetical protein [Phenylobacterium sp.]MCA6228277.1 hypothetical protein [Phenylobacterium sp.]MCA6242895.1 hypothetical protein [Phenylobacterium sp.]MCA6278612.1 hypothetical protein [Phenylobacterium sp.]